MVSMLSKLLPSSISNVVESCPKTAPPPVPPAPSKSATDEASPFPAELHRRGGAQQELATPESSPAQTTSFEVNEISLTEVFKSDRIFHQATVLGVLSMSASEALRLVCMWLLVVAPAYFINPSDNWECLRTLAGYMLVVLIFFVLMHPLGLPQIHTTRPLHSIPKRPDSWTGILVWAVAVQCAAIIGAIFCAHKDKISKLS